MCVALLLARLSSQVLLAEGVLMVLVRAVLEKNLDLEHYRSSTAQMKSLVGQVF